MVYKNNSGTEKCTVMVMQSIIFWYVLCENGSLTSAFVLFQHVGYLYQMIDLTILLSIISRRGKSKSVCPFLLLCHIVNNTFF
jgi:hypothetical protein